MYDNSNGFTFLVPAYEGCPGKEAITWPMLLATHQYVQCAAEKHPLQKSHYFRNNLIFLVNLSEVICH